MPAQHPVIRHRFGGGWATDFGPTAEVDFSSTLVTVPWLNEARNVSFLLDGGARKVGGTEKLNSAALESGVSIRGMFDFWRLGTGGSHANKRVIHVGTTVKKDDADGSFSDIATGFAADSIPSYAQFDDNLIVMSTAETPRTYNQTTMSVLGTNTPNGAFGVTYKNRFWISGVDTDPSKLYYSEALPNGPGGDWNAATAGSLNIEPGDGDRITGLAVHKKELWVFKGPYKGSIHRISGDSPTGSATSGATPFVRNGFIEGVGAVGHNTIFKYQDDIGFMWSDGTIRSLNATAAFGDFVEGSLSLPINTFLRERLNTGRLNAAWATTLPGEGCVVFTVPKDTSTTNNLMLCMDFRFIPVERQPRWSEWDHVTAGCVATVIDSTNQNIPRLFTGGNDGFVRRMGRANRSVDGTTAYTSKVAMPYLNYGTPMQMKTLENAGLGVFPRGTFDLTFGWTRDNKARQTATVSQGGGDVLASGGSTAAITAFATHANGVKVTSAGHGLADGTEVSIYGTTSYNGRFEVADSDTNDFTIVATFVADDATGNWQTAAEANFFVLGVSVLGGASFVERFLNLESAGEFRSAQFDVSQGGNNEDMEIHTITVDVKPGALSVEN